MQRMRSIALAVALAAPFALQAGQTVDINNADAETLAKVIDGIGIAKAQAIVDYRKTNGPFRSVEGLAAVKGIGERTVERNRDRLTVGAASAAGPATANPAAPNPTATAPAGASAAPTPPPAPAKAAAR